MEQDFENMNDEEFEEYCKEQFPALEAYRDAMKGVIAKVRDNYICDCEINYGKDCKYPERYRNGGCN